MYSQNGAHSCADHLPHAMSGGLELPPRQRPAPRAVVFATPPDELTTILASIRNTVVGAIESIRRAAASRGIS